MTSRVGKVALRTYSQPLQCPMSAHRDGSTAGIIKSRLETMSEVVDDRWIRNGRAVDPICSKAVRMLRSTSARV